jgi:hypothetical protein
VPVIVQYIELRQQVQQVALVPGSQDRLVWRWCASGCYSANSAHKFLFQGQKGVLGAKELWKVRAPNKCRFFLWLVLHQLCWTSEGLHRHALHDDGACALCQQELETLDHLLVRCVVNREGWWRLLHRFGWHHLAPALDSSVVEWWLHTRKCVAK